MSANGFEIHALPTSVDPEKEMHIGYRGYDIPIPAETVRMVYAHPPGKRDATFFLYFQDGNKDVGRIEFPRDLAERVAHEIHDLIAENRPTKPSL